MGTLIEAKGICQTFDTLEVLRNIHMEANPGEFVSILGRSGSGKTTLLNVLAGIAKPVSGDVFVDGCKVTGTAGHASYMYQKDLLMPWRSALDNAILPLVIQGMKRKEARQKVLPYFTLFGLEGCEDKYPFLLSGGMQKRVALLRTYLFSAGLMLLDEPFAGLDEITKRQMHGWLLNVLEQLNTTVILITHDIEEAIFLSDRIYVLSQCPAEVCCELVVELPRPRSGKDLLSEQAVQYQLQLEQALGLTI